MQIGHQHPQRVPGKTGQQSLSRVFEFAREDAKPRGVARPACLALFHQSLSKVQKAMSISAINARNQINGVIKHITVGDVVSEVELETPVGAIISVITTTSLKYLNLQVGTEAIAVVKATEVAIAKP